MPRARINAPEDEAVLPKPRPRKPRAVSVEELVIPVTRKRAIARPRISETLSAPELVRKAPTVLASRRRSHSKKSKSILLVLGICVVLSAIGVGIGVLDTGTIDVIAVVNERNEKINKGEVRDEAGNAVTKTIDVQNGDTRPNGGLPMGDPIAPPAPPVQETSTSTEAVSNTESAATSTASATDAASTTEEAI